MEKGSSSKTIMEPAREVKVCRQADVVVVGGGPGGHSAAVAAARNGADTVLVERYGHLGGMATGGLVILIPHMSDGTQEQQIAGLCQEWLDRLDARGAAVHPKKEELGSSDKEIVEYWRNFSHFFVCHEGRVQLNAVVDPEILKCVLNDMVDEAGVKLFLHSWGTQAIVDNGEVQGVIFESKSGRQAILAKVVIDGTGDGDLLPSAGAEFIRQIDPNLRISKVALCFLFGNVDIKRLSEFKQSNPEKHTELMRELADLDGFPVYLRTTREDVIWFNNLLPGLDILNVEDLTWVEVNVRKRMLITYDFFKKYVPGFENSFIMTTATQTGTRGSRRVVGEHMLTEKDIHSGAVYEDTIAVCPDLHNVVSPEHPHVHIPYRTLVPRQVERLLVAGRSFSSEDVVNERYNLITHCIAMGEAAGTAAALAIKNNVRLRDVDYAVLQDRLIAQGVPMPGVARAGVKK